MKISHLTIENIRGITSLDMTPQKLNFIAGRSGAGKSSVFDAIRYALTGKLGKENVHNAAMRACVEMDIDRIGEINRSIDILGKSKVKLNGKTTTAKSVAEQFLTLYNISSTSLNMLTSSELTEHMLGKDLAEYLLTEGFLKNDMTFSHLLALNPLPTDVADELKKMLPSEPDVITLEDIESAYQNSRNTRAALKQMIAEAQTLAKYDGYVPEHTSAELQKLMASVQKKIAAEQQKKDDCERVKKSNESLLKNIADTEAQLRRYESVKPVTAREKELAAENKNNVQKLIENISQAVLSTNNDICFIQNTLNALETSQCPIHKDLICTTDKTSVRSSLEDTLDEKLDALKMLTHQLEDSKKAMETAKAACDALIKQEGDYKMRLSLFAQLERLKETKIIVPEDSDGTKIPVLQTQLNRLQEEYDAARRSEEAQKQRTRANMLGESYRKMDVLCQQLAVNGGIRQQVLSHSIGPLETWCNEMLKAALPKYTLHFDAADSFAVVMEDTTGGRVLYENLSTGEQLRTIFVIMSMLNELNGTRILLLDNLNALDVASFDEFVRFIEHNASSYDHVFLAGIDHAGFVDAFNRCTVPHQCVLL